MSEEKPCNPHPDAPHGFNRDASHAEGRYVCECEFWEPEAAPSQEPVGMVRWVKGRPVGELTNYDLRPNTPLYTAPPDAAAQIADLEHTVMKNCTELNAKDRQIATLEAEIERERMRLAACGAAALGYFEGCKDEYKSASLDDVLQLREKLAAAEKDAARLNYIADFCKLRHLESGLWSWQTGLSSTPHLRDALDAAMKLSAGDTADD